jgi:type III secretory pathway lipoprotein EscJ
MRTENPVPPASAFVRIRAYAARARRWVADRGTTTRWTLALAALAAVVAAAYVASPTDPIGSDWLYDGHKFSRDEAFKITNALIASGIESSADKQGRIVVPADRVAASLNVIQKQKLEPHSLADLLDKSSESHLLEGSFAQEQRIRRTRDAVFEAMIKHLKGIASATVVTNQVRPRSFSQPWSATALVTLEAEGGRQVPGSTILAIQTTLLGGVPELKPDGVTVVDSQGRSYLVAGNRALVVQSQTRADEEELADELMERLDWIDGVRVFVKLGSPAAPSPEVGPAQVEPVTVRVNGPLDSDPKPAADASGRAAILVQVPMSHYRDGFRRAAPNREPSSDDLRAYVEKTEDSIRNAVVQVVPDAKLTIDRINVPSASEPDAVPAHPEGRHLLAWWIPVALASGLAVVAIAGGGVLAARRPAARPVRRTPREPFDLDEDEASRPGPSERVRDLLRLNPEAAAGVLQRWIGQGGHTG